ncbi:MULTISPECIES: AraC family transcriptional regulator [Photorhabdus]|uniref:Arabinose operon regulatory protein n=2 Tax=Photorhabdus TaxID=29487 RepID=A0ABX0AX28_9GAMM|nr:MULTISPECIES: helix-turn-helix transcriptional regulator [Photorhabdus]MCC8372503.1 helix-turn-helix transcriptional regulator [Photorhabdus bodei]MCC8464926.1 helix-turn-helix transcriptional regulator [Photorhabdus bodei]MCT8354075.1 helix-turn-helix transcriptional regulator [Photorhabdus kayaii]MDB6368121.1 helix-turn-helix transcriptional regulator [Photorhabdus bodei]MDB6371644.1 helix-turn-helix transcriptional regulator [Photorhabdus bodei]
MTEKLNEPVDIMAIPASISFRNELFSANTECLRHTHPFGQLIYVVCGVMAMNAGGQHFLAPPQFCVWIPEGIEHSGYSRKAMRFRAIDISPKWGKLLPNTPCIIRLNSIFNAIMTDCFERKLKIPETEQDLRLAQVLIDQLIQSPVQHTYLPSSKDKLLAPILQELESNPADNTPLARWAKQRYTSERTLSRRCQQELGMSFSEWRQRLRFLHAISLLEQGKTVNEVAFDVGYSSSSAFIAMFQQLAGTTPERFRKS